VELSHRIVGPDGMKGVGAPKAPHYLLISGKPHALRDLCAGFKYQHAELFMYSLGLATRWAVMIKSRDPDPDHIIGMSFGRPKNSGTRRTEDFDRKPLSEIADGSDDRLEAARLAPSGLNAQPWHFIVSDGAIHSYYATRIGGLMGRMYDMMPLDLGIALAHIDVASQHSGRPFSFSVEGNPPTAPKGFAYAGTVR